MNKKIINIGLIGLGTVGQGVVEILSKFDDINIVAAAVKNKKKKRKVKVDCITDNPYDIANNEQIDIVVEVAGGTEIKDVLLTAIKNKKHVVTANKELLAKYGAELFDEARKQNVVILYEAAVAGGIPIIMPIKTGLKANEFNSVAGILNGTTNYILTKMDEEKISYTQCLKKAQELGYAEANPTNDVEGYDSMYKIAILANIVFNKRIRLDKIYREGITKISALDIEIADELGYKIKLIAQAKKLENSEELDIRVHPMFVKKDKAISNIKNATNAVMLNGFPVDKIMFAGPGAGKYPTTSSVIGDILSIKSELSTEEKTILPMTICHHKKYASQINITKTINCYYLRIQAKNKIGIIGKIGCACEKYKISLSSLVQKGTNEDGSATILVVTELAKEKDINNMILTLEKNKDIKVANKIRVM